MTFNYKEWKRNYRATHPEYVQKGRVYNKQYKLKNAVKVKAKERLYRKNNPEFVAWHHMKQRCTNPKNKDYKYYGGRGITICGRWTNSHIPFLADMGRRPSKSHSIDRINNDGDYEPNNCRWATKPQQMANRRPYASC